MAFCSCARPLVKYADGTAYCDDCGEEMPLAPRDRVLVQIARAVASIERRLDELEKRTASPHERTLLKPAELAQSLGLHRNWVYANKVQLGAIAIGDGPRPRLMFDPEVARQRLASCSTGSRALDDPPTHVVNS